MTFSDVLNIALARVDEDTTDTQVVSIIKSGINEGYMFVAANADKIQAEISFPYSTILPLPADYVETVMLTHSDEGELAEGVDYIKKGDNLLIRASDVSSGTFTLLYNKFPQPLVNDTDVLQVHDAYGYVIAAYGAYVYMMMRRKYDAAAMLLSEFASLVPMPKTGGQQI